MPKEKKLHPPQHQRRQPGREHKMEPRPRAEDKTHRGSDLFAGGYDNKKTTRRCEAEDQEGGQRGRAKTNDCAFVEKKAYRSRKRRSQGRAKETKALEIKVRSGVHRCECNVFAIITDLFSTALSSTFAGT